ncbi:TM2 domain-containing protein [Pseudomonas aeruginosa]|uniref:TM2 domain-containing protein n=1 Tax=Pseudomonas aeruginosa TaxID=287 RepID=UPI000708C264|nr:TM2 domain-containing protein [Pseudomonas aeruginosa]
MSLQSEMLVEQKVSNAQKSTGTAYLLWFFLGGFGAHRFYLGKTGTAVTQLIITLIGCFTLFPLIIFLIPGIIQGHTEQTRRDARLEVAALQVAGASVSHPQD